MPLPHIEIACDESGFSGGNLVGGGHSTVFAHASVRIDLDDATTLVRHVHRLIGAKGGEYKSAELLRPRHRAALRWLLGPTSPLPDASRVLLIDTRLYVLGRVVDVLLGPHPVSGIDLPAQARASRATALTLYRSGDRAYGIQLWQAFLRAAGNLFRTNNRWLPDRPVEIFYDALDALAANHAGGEIGEVITRLQQSRDIAVTTRDGYVRNPRATPLMEPLIPAVARAVESWGSEAAALTVVHDEQSALTPARIADMASAFTARHPGQHLVGIQLVDSRHDARVQTADFLAGIALRLARDLLSGHPDPDLMPMLIPLVDPESVWPHRFARAARPPRTKEPL